MLTAWSQHLLSCRTYCFFTHSGHDHHRPTRPSHTGMARLRQDRCLVTV